MIMMGPKKDKGGLMIAIMEKLKNGKGSYEEGKEHNEEMMEKHHDGHGHYEKYKEEVDGMVKAMEHLLKGEDEDEHKEEFAKCLKMFVKKCVKDEY